MVTEQPVYRYVKGLGYLPIEENALEKYVPELGVVLDLSSVDLSDLNGCPSQMIHTDIENKDQSADNSGDDDDNKYWKEYLKNKANR